MHTDQLSNILFIDIETVPVVSDYQSLSDGMQQQWIKKAGTLRGLDPENADPAALFSERAGVFSEFAKVVCIVIGCLGRDAGGWNMKLKSLYGDDEKELLNKFCLALSKFAHRHPGMRFCGHNIREFDIPFLCRRMIIHGMDLPGCMELRGRKPWDIPHLDTLELWRFGDYKNYTSLGLLAEVLGIPSPKDDMDGSMVGPVYWQQGDLERIARYCRQDVYTTALVYLRLQGLSQLQPVRHDLPAESA